MSEPTKEVIFVTVGVSEDSWATVPKDGALTLDEAKCHALAQEFINGNVTQGTTTAMLVSAIIAHVRKAARDDALEGAKAALNDERVDGTVSPEDAAYNTAIDHCIAALDALKDKPDGET